MVLTNGFHNLGVSQEPTLLRNDHGKKWVVQKFGGISLGRFAENIVEGIVRLVFPPMSESVRKTDSFSNTEYQPESYYCGMLCPQQQDEE
jgi:hypothetical protein